MKKPLAILIFLLSAGAGLAQLTTEQRLAEFQGLSNLFIEHYGLYEWKRDVIHFDMLDVAPWLERVRNAKDDLEFFEVCNDYIGSLWDAHSAYIVPSTFEAKLGFTVDVYDGKVLIDSIDRDLLDAEAFPFQIGDELVSLDDRSADELMTEFTRYSREGNPRTARHFAAGMIALRWQDLMPHAVNVGDSARVAIRRANGDLETYTVPWIKSGTPVTSLAPGRSPYGPKVYTRRATAANTNSEPAWMRPLRELQTVRMPARQAFTQIGQLHPVFELPDGFVTRLGGQMWDSLFSGTYQSGGKKIGFVRIPDFEYPSTAEFEDEITFFEANTDGLVIDIMHNPGGDACLMERLLARVINRPFQVNLVEARVTWGELLSVTDALRQARDAAADRSTIRRLEALVDAYKQAYESGNGHARPLPFCGTSGTAMPAKNADGVRIAYTKPVIVLIDELSGSCGDIFAAVMQDNHRGPLFGMRTVGAGGSVRTIAAGIYSDALANITISMVRRKDPLATSDYPTSAYLENIGVRPDIEMDYMTRDNLVNGGRAFVETFTTKLVEQINAAQ